MHETTKEVARMVENRIRVAPHTVAYADEENHKLVVEFAIPGAPTETIDVKLLPDSVHLTAPAKDIEYVSALALAMPVKPDKAEAIYENGLLRIEGPSIIRGRWQLIAVLRGRWWHPGEGSVEG